MIHKTWRKPHEQKHAERKTKKCREPQEKTLVSDFRAGGQGWATRQGHSVSKYGVFKIYEQMKSDIVSAVR